MAILSSPLFSLTAPIVVAVVCFVGFVLLYRQVRRRLSSVDIGGQSQIKHVAEHHLTKAQRQLSNSNTVQITKNIGGESIIEREKMLIKRITKDPGDIEAYELLGEVYLVQDNFEDAKECFGQVLTLSPGHVRAKKQLARVQKLMNVS